MLGSFKSSNKSVALQYCLQSDKRSHVEANQNSIKSSFSPNISVSPLFDLSHSTHSRMPENLTLSYLEKQNTTMRYGSTLTISTMGIRSQRSAKTQYFLFLAQGEIQLSLSCPFHGKGKDRAWCERVGGRKGAALGCRGRRALARAFLGRWLSWLSLLQLEPLGPLTPCLDHCCGPAALP